MAEEGAEAVAEVTSEMGKTVLKEAARSALDLSLKLGENFNLSLKIENPWLAAIVGAFALGAFYIHRNCHAQPAERNAAERALENPEVRTLVDAIRNGLEINGAGVIDPEVMRIENGSIQVALVCHTEQSLLLFLDDFEAGKVKERLEKEFRKLGCEEELKVAISNLDEVHKRLNQTRVEDAENKAGDFENRTEKVESTGTDSVKGQLISPGFYKVDPTPPSKGTHFIGREAVVQEIVQKLTQDPNPSRIVIIVGIPGMGKTEVAIHVSHLIQEKHKKTVIFIEQKKMLSEVCSEILRKINPLASKLSESHDVVSMAKWRLKELDEKKVIVLDDVAGIQQQGEEFDDFLEYVGRHAPRVQLIITTREDVGFHSLGLHKVRLDGLDPESSAKLLQDLAPNCEEQYIKELGKLCGGIPLVLANCAVLLEEGFSPEVLVEQLKENPIQLLKTHAEDVYNVLRQFLLNMSENIKASLVRLSVFPSSFSVKDMEIVFGDVLEPEAVKNTMLRRSLLRRIDIEKMVLHPLVREFLKVERKLLNMDDVGKTAEHKFNQHYLELLETLSKQFISKEWSQNAISTFRREKRNILEMFNNFVREESVKKETESFIDVANSTKVLDFLARVSYPPSECAELYNDCRHIAKASNDMRRLADCLTSLGFLDLFKQAHRGVSQNTLEKFQRAYEIRKNLPKEQQHCETHARTMSKLGLCYALQGEKEKGLKLIQEAIDLRKELGVRLYVAAAYLDLGIVHRASGDHEQAINIWKTKTLPVYKDELGDHPWTASILRYIAISYRCLAISESADSGMADLAEMYSREALESRFKLLGEHQGTARSYIDLSDILIVKQDYKSAIEQLEEAFEIQKKVLGEEHEATKKTLEKLREIQSMVQ